MSFLIVFNCPLQLSRIVWKNCHELSEKINFYRIIQLEMQRKTDRMCAPPFFIYVKIVRNCLDCLLIVIIVLIVLDCHCFCLFVQREWAIIGIIPISISHEAINRHVQVSLWISRSCPIVVFIVAGLSIPLKQLLSTSAHIVACDPIVKSVETHIPILPI